MKPKSVCGCEHTGDGPMSEHKDDLGLISPGHGECEVRGCSCIKFTWKRFVSRVELAPSPYGRQWVMLSSLKVKQ